MISNLGIVDTKKIIAAIKDNYGVDFIDYTLTTLKNRFNKVLSFYNINSVEDFIEQINFNNININELYDLMMIDTTEMFRDPSLWRELREKYLPEINKSIGSKIWMAGVSSGEELYSLMIILKELELANPIKVVASCPSLIRIDRIKKGNICDVKKMEVGEANYTRLSGKYSLSKYYSVKANKVEMDTSLLKDVEIDNINISQERPNKLYRLIIFRNVLIRYNQPLYEKTIRKLVDSLVVGGYLIIGNKETLEYSEIGKKMQLVNEVEKIYKKRVI
jgi:chemotaxis protein methyltransferase CheR